MKRLVQAGTVAGVCGLVLFGSGAAQAQTPPNGSLLSAVTGTDGSLLSAVTGADLATVTGMMSGVLCDNRLVDFNYQSPRVKSPHPCVNGPVHSGNNKNSNNFRNRGNPVDAGNPKIAAGSTNSLNESHGNERASHNDISKIAKLVKVIR
ncbi:hypothetical protein [Streptomyces sp. GS7]|uniref:hypothetical protein n=1 Tax=Streptomyces sp. GS7 TaxID=2692234 RepID=UPI001F299B85|nr:hypothetical protein [Streptomyces sp. GS7]